MKVKNESANSSSLDLLWGAQAIADELGITPKRAFYFLEQGFLPAKKVGNSWCASRRALLRHFEVEAA